MVYEKYYQLGKKYDMTKFNDDGSTEFDLDRVDMVKAQASAIAQRGDRWSLWEGDSNPAWSSYRFNSTNFSVDLLKQKVHDLHLYSDGTGSAKAHFYFMVGTA